jgi:hypothetical protein
MVGLVGLAISVGNTSSSTTSTTADAGAMFEQMAKVLAKDCEGAHANVGTDRGPCRILRPKADGRAAYFYTIVAAGTDDARFAGTANASFPNRATPTGSRRGAVTPVPPAVRTQVARLDRPLAIHRCRLAVGRLTPEASWRSGPFSPTVSCALGPDRRRFPEHDGVSRGIPGCGRGLSHDSTHDEAHPS